MITSNDTFLYYYIDLSCAGITRLGFTIFELGRASGEIDL